MSVERLFPHPVISATLAVLWLWLNQALGLGHIVLAALLAITVPHLVDRVLAPARGEISVRRALAFAWLVLGDIVVANLTVARLILGRSDRLRPAFVTVPLDVERGWAITLLASTVSLTPGTVSAEVSEDKRSLLVHALTVREDEDLARHLKERYERPIMELSI